MKKIFSLSLSGFVAAILWMPITSANSAETSVEQRLQRLERMTENPVLLQLSRRLGEQQREIQELHDDIDRLKRDIRNANYKADKRYKETDDRLSVLESGSGNGEREPLKQAEIAPTLVLPATVETPSITQSVVEAVAEQPPAVTKPQKNLAEKVVANQIMPASVSDVAVVENSAIAKAELKAPKSPVESKVVALAPIKTTPATELEKAKYQKAFSLMKTSQYDTAIKAFQEFLETFPNSELASNAAYWAGEGQLIRKQNQAALDSFMIVIERYTDSSKEADARLRAADSLANLNRVEEAQKMYQSVINGRPHSRAAKTASKRLSGL